MSKIYDFVGKRFGRLEVMEKVGSKNNNVYWLCKCDCGTVISKTTTQLTSLKSISCGCLRKDTTASLNKTHGMSNTRIYNIWVDMKRRCDNPKRKHYERYGGRGINYCKEWNNFNTFYKDMSITYKDNLEIDRINGDGNYEPSNCRWITHQQQLNNYSRNVFITIYGVTDTVKNMCTKYNSRYDNVVRHIKRGDDPLEMINKYKY